ncbi:MAG: DNA-3-methyladenine glycosylase [Vicinamibacteria bacterium]
MTRLGRRFYRRDPVTLAKALLGQILVRRFEDGRELRGRIVDVEAYLGILDRAAHSFSGRRTARNASMWLDAGHAYVYFTYGMHWCVNVVADREGIPTACLIRALEPLQGIEEMRRRRSRKLSTECLRDTDLCSGPAKLTEALGIDRSLDGVDLVEANRLTILRGPSSARAIVESSRIGVGYAQEWAEKPLRFFLRGNPHVSGAKRVHKNRGRRSPQETAPSFARREID